jgi:signal transduction histidine kinase
LRRFLRRRRLIQFALSFALWSELVLASPLQDEVAERPASLPARGRAAIVGVVRAVPIRWRILAIAALNSAVVVVLVALIWNGAKVLGSAWDDVRQVRNSDKILALLESETGRLHTLIHRYINQPSPELFAEILLLREAVLGTLTTRASTDPMLSGSVAELERVTERFLNGFGELRGVQAAISRTYEEQVLTPAREMAGLYSIIEGATGHRDAAIWPSLGKSREAFTAMLVAANAHLSLASASAEQARLNAETIEKTIPVMSDLADNDLQRLALDRLKERTASLREGLGRLSDQLASRTELLRNTIDASQAEAIVAIDGLSVKMREHEQKAQETFDRTLGDISRRVLSIAVIFLGIIITAGVLIALSIRLPLQQIMAAMHAITSGDYHRHVQGTRARDEVGAMARAVEVFRENAIAKRKTEDELRASKERAEGALLELNAAQQNLIDAERLAALGGLVAGVAHEVNNPIGISLTVASSFSRRAEMFDAELKSGAPLRRSQLEEFVRISGDAARQLASNLHRAGELIQSFKQVAVDRSHAERRQFSLGEATDQIIASLRPVLKKAPIAVSVDVPNGLVIDGYPGSYGQILTNLFLNAAAHAFPDGRGGTISISAQPRGADDIEMVFADNGAGMSPDVQRQAFDPFFTTRRNEGGTGLGLHIVYNLVTQQLGGRMMLESRPGQGTTFRIIMPRTARGYSEAADQAIDGTSQWPNRTMSST